MKICSPVSCEVLLRPKIQPQKDQVWCIALDRRGQYLWDFPVNKLDFLVKNRETRSFLKILLRLEAEALVFGEGVRNPRDLWDFDFLQGLARQLDKIEIEIWDYLLLGPGFYKSLVDYDPTFFEFYEH